MFLYPEVDHPNASGLNTSFEQVNRLFRNDFAAGRLRFTDVTQQLGPGLRGRKCSRGASLIDFDNDGDLDIFVSNLNAPPDLVVNRLGAKRGHWLMLRLRGNPAKKVNLDAIGCKVLVTAGGRTQYLETKRGEGFLGCHDPRCHVGLGAATAAHLKITWPNGEVTEHDFSEVDRAVEIALK